MLFNGDGILKDNKKAAYWIEKSYNNGWEQAAPILEASRTMEI